MFNIIQKTSNNIFQIFYFQVSISSCCAKSVITLERTLQSQFLISRVKRKNMCNVPKRITLQKFRNSYSKRMQGFQKRKNNSKQIIIVYFEQIKHLKENGTKKKVKHILVRHVIYKQCISLICTQEHIEKIIQVFMENRLVRLFREEMFIFEAKRLVYYS